MTREAIALVIADDAATDIVRWTQWQVTLATAASDKDIRRAIEESRSYAASILSRLVRDNPTIAPGHAEAMAAIDARKARPQ